MPEDTHKTIRLTTETCDRLGRYTTYADNTWELRIARVLNLLEGRAFDQAESIEDLDAIEIPLHTIPQEMVALLTRLKRQRKTEIRKNGKKK